MLPPSGSDDRKSSLWFGIATLAAVLLAVGVTVAILVNQRASSSPTPPATGTLAPTAAPTASPSTAAPTVSLAPSAAPTAVPTATGTPTPAPTPSPASAAVETSGSGVNTGVVAGGVIGALAVVLMLGAVAFVWHRRRGAPAPRDGEQSVSLYNGDDSESLESLRKRPRPPPTTTTTTCPPEPPPRRRRRKQDEEEEAPPETYVFPVQEADALSVHSAPGCTSAEGVWEDALLALREEEVQPGNPQIATPLEGLARAILRSVEEKRRDRHVTQRLKPPGRVYGKAPRRDAAGRPSSRSVSGANTDADVSDAAASDATHGTLWSARSRTSAPVGRLREELERRLTNAPPLPPVTAPRGPRSTAGPEQTAQKKGRRRRHHKSLRTMAHRARRREDDAQIDLLGSVQKAYAEMDDGEEEEDEEDSHVDEETRGQAAAPANSTNDDADEKCV